MRRLVVVLLVVVLALAGAAAAIAWRAGTPSRAVDPAEALAAYRAADGPATAAGTGASAGGPPRPGVYRYAVDGWECGGIGSLCLRRELPGESLLVVSEDAGSLVLQRRRSEDHLEEQRFDRRPDGRWLTAQRQHIRFVGVGRDQRDAAEPPALVLPAPLRVGQRWTATFRLRELRTTSRSRVVRAERIAVGGRPLDALVVQTRTETRGAFSGREDVTAWFVPALGLDARRTVRRVLDGSFRYELELDERLVAAEPAG